MDKVSIIIPVFNGEKYLARCIDSLLNQSYENNEYIFVNDGSIDHTLNILKKFQQKDKRIVIINKENTGVSDSRNQGIKKAKGKYICFCDADDMYEKKYIETMLDLIKKNNVDAVRCNFKVINKKGQTIDSGKSLLSNQKLNHESIINEVIPHCLNGTIPCFTYLLMVKKEKLKVQFPEDIAMMEDVVFYINLFLTLDNFYITNDTLYTIMFNESGATNNVKNYRRNINNVILVNKYIKDILKKSNLLTAQNVEKLNINHLNAIADFIFKHYLYGKNTIQLCQSVRNDSLLQIIAETNLKNISLVRRIIFVLIQNKHYILLKVYFFLRKIIFNLKRGNI